MLPSDLKAKAVRTARDRGISFGELVRRALGAALQEPTGAGPYEDSLFADGVVYDGPSPPDLAVAHDTYLYRIDDSSEPRGEG